jgi:hypothetical protein
MNKVMIIFETTSDIADFIIRRKIRNAHVDSREVSVTAVMNPKDIEFAQTEYNAQLVRPRVPEHAD